MVEMKLYINRITSKMLYGFIHRDNSNRLAIALKIDEVIFEKLIIETQETNYITAEVSNGVIVGVNGYKNNDDNNIQDFILNLIGTKQTRKKDIYKKIKEKYNISDKSIQRKLKELKIVNSNIKTNYNYIWVE